MIQEQYTFFMIFVTTTNIDRTCVLNDSLQSDRTYIHFTKQQSPKAWKQRCFGCLSNASPFSRIFLLYDLKEAGFSHRGWFLLLLRQPGTLLGVPSPGAVRASGRGSRPRRLGPVFPFAKLRDGQAGTTVADS